MARHPHPDDDPLRLVVAGAGVAGLETLVALRGLVGHRVALTLVAPQDDFAVRALEVFEPFGLGCPHRYPVAALAADLDAAFQRDAVARVDCTSPDPRPCAPGRLGGRCRRRRPPASEGLTTEAAP
jgi:sulfide:quinone oxidoreductase